jgi:hypothetical protein
MKLNQYKDYLLKTIAIAIILSKNLTKFTVALRLIKLKYCQSKHYKQLVEFLNLAFKIKRNLVAGFHIFDIYVQPYYYYWYVIVVVNKVSFGLKLLEE